MANMHSRSMRLVSAPLEVLAVQEEDGIPLHLISTNHPSLEDGYDQTALSSSCYTKQYFVLLTTPFASSSTLELRTFHLHSSAVNAAPHHIQFPAPILPGIRLIDAKDESVLLQACTSTGYAYRIHIPLNLLHSIDDIPNRWMIEQRLSNVSTDVKTVVRESMLSITHCSNDGQVMLISCSDGKMIKLAWQSNDGSDGYLDGSWHESVLRPTSFFGRLFGRAGSSNATPHISSIATYARSTSWSSILGFTVSQDRRMRVWDLGSDACIRTIELPQGSSTETDLVVGVTDTDDESRESSPAPFVRPAFVRTVSASQDDGSSPYALYVLITVPAAGTSNSFLACYGIQLSEMSSSSSRHYNGSVGDIDLLWQRRFDHDVSNSDVELRDMSIISVDDHWDIWCVWDAAGRTVIKKLSIRGTSSLSKVDERWLSVNQPISYSSLFGAQLDEDLSDLDAADLGPFFIQRIVEPGRFSVGSLDEATKAYEKALLSRQVDPVQLPTTSSMQSNIREHILGLVGCTVQLMQDESTGAPMYDEYFADLKREWIIFLSLLRQADSNERWPISFAGERKDDSGSFYSPFVSSRGWLSLPVEENEACSLLRRGNADEQEEELDDDEDHIKNLVEFGLQLKANIQPHALRQFETALDETLSTQPARVIEDVADALWTTHLVDALSVDEEELKDGFASIEADFSGTVSTILLILQSTPSSKGKVEGMSVSYENTELFTAFASDALTQTISDKLSLAKVLMIVVLSAHAGFFDQDEKTYTDASVSELVRQVVIAYHKLSALDLAAHIDGVAEVTFNEPKFEDDPNDADHVAKKIGQLQFNGQKEEIALYSDATASNLVHRALLRGFIPNLVQKSDSWFSSITQYASDALRLLIFSTDDSDVIEAGASFVHFANQSLISGHPLAAIELMKKFPPSSAGQFITGRSLLALGDAGDAATAFEKVLPVFDHWSDEQSSLGSGLYDILPANIRDAETANEAAFLFCKLAVLHFRRARYLPHVARFASLALSYANSASAVERKYKVRELHLALFRSHVEMEEYADAYFYLLAIPFDDLQRESLRTLISIMCEQGKVEELLSFNFAGLQAEVERTLSFKARNSDPLHEGINYYHILYAFHVQRSDLKSAGATMWQMGVRIRDIYRRKIVQARRAQYSAGLLSTNYDEEEQKQLQGYAILEAECYLASINALSLINEDNAWFAHEVSEGEDDILTKIESARLTSYLPLSSFQSKTREIRIVHVRDVRNRYRLLLAQLELVTLYPDEAIAIMTSNANDATSAVELFVRDQDFERALMLARSAKLNRTQIYVALTDRCLELARWDEEREKRNKALRNGKDEHPLMRALFEDQDMTDFNLANLGRENAELIYEEKSAPSARFLERSDRCVSWKGSTNQRAWRYLRLWLEMENDDGNDQFAKERYFIQVLRRILARQCWHLTPKWLLEWLRENEVNKFIRTLLDHDYISIALEESCQLVKRSTEYVSNSTKRRKTGEPIASQTYLPYLLFDELLKRGEEAPATNPTNSSLLEQRQNAKKLRDSIEAHKEELKRIESGIRRNLNEDEIRQRKLTAAAFTQQEARITSTNIEQDAQMTD